MLIHDPLGVGRAQELSHLDGSRLAIFLALPAEPAREIRQNRADNAA